MKNRTSLAEGWDNYHACNESRRIQRLQGFEPGGHSKAGSLGRTGTRKDHSGRGHTTRTHHSVGGDTHERKRRWSWAEKERAWRRREEERPFLSVHV